MQPLRRPASAVSPEPAQAQLHSSSPTATELPRVIAGSSASFDAAWSADQPVSEAQLAQFTKLRQLLRAVKLSHETFGELLQMRRDFVTPHTSVEDLSLKQQRDLGVILAHTIDVVHAQISALESLLPAESRRVHVLPSVPASPSSSLMPPPSSASSSSAAVSGSGSPASSMTGTWRWLKPQTVPPIALMDNPLSNPVRRVSTSSQENQTHGTRSSRSLSTLTTTISSVFEARDLWNAWIDEALTCVKDKRKPGKGICLFLAEKYWGPDLFIDKDKDTINWNSDGFKYVTAFRNTINNLVRPSDIDAKSLEFSLPNPQDVINNMGAWLSEERREREKKKKDERDKKEDG